MTASPVGRVVVVLGSGADEVAADGRSARRRHADAERWEEGQAASLACGLAELADCEAVVVTLGDQPRMAPDAIRRVIAAAATAPRPCAPPTGASRATPCCWSQALFERLRDVTGDHGARNLLLSVQAARSPATTSAAARTWTRRPSSTRSGPGAGGLTLLRRGR